MQQAPLGLLLLTLFLVASKGNGRGTCSNPDELDSSLGEIHMKNIDICGSNTFTSDFCGWLDPPGSCNEPTKGDEYVLLLGQYPLHREVTVETEKASDADVAEWGTRGDDPD
ncbi:hypothetical protein DUNSADRAFT_5430, partial [Dunaliella salina]